MKLLYCAECDKHSRIAIAMVRVQAEVRMNADGKWYANMSLDDAHVHGLKALTVDEFSLICSVCGQPIQVIDMDKDDCPHSWHSSFCATRECLFCGLFQEGKVVFDEEES